MTPTSEERREAAARLRDNDHGYYTECDFFLHALGMPRHVLIPYDWAKVHERLADLIDPTCYVESTDSTGRLLAYRLSCGDTAYVAHPAPRPSYCPICGARVVNDDDW